MNKILKIMYDSPEAAQYKTVEGWVSSDGRFWGKDEDIARYSGSTHRLCKTCGAEHETRGGCPMCARRRQAERYDAMPFQEWDGTTPLVLFDDDHYFFDEDELVDYVETNGLQYSDLKLCVCDPNVAREIDEDHWADDLAEDRTLDDTDSGLAVLVEAVNEYIRENKPILSWIGGKFRTSYSPKEA